MRARKFVAIDGESFTTAESHNYVLLASSTGDTIFDDAGLSTQACLDFLIQLRTKAKWYIFVAYGLNYDVNMMLKDLSLEDLKELWTDHCVKWRGYKLEWIPGKWFSVRKGSVSVRVYDVFGFFQSSFVNALRKWDIEPQADMEDMKAARSSFDAAMKDRIVAYCLTECEQLVELMERMKSALVSVNLTPRSWVGAGSIASSLLSRSGVRYHHQHDFAFPPQVQNAVLHAYFGGRVELFQQGYYDRVTNYDVVSAYPSCALHLPSLVNGAWREADAYEPAARHALWEVRWSVDPDARLMPFPYRRDKGIYYPSAGRGWYHHREVKTALSVYPDDVEVIRGWVYESFDDYEPFGFIRTEYDHRRELKAKGHPAEKVLKLGLNAIYGKLAQGHGWNGELPTYQSFFWAGEITAATRARLLDIASLAPYELLMIATDGIFFTQPAPDIVTAPGVLGGLERSELSDVFIAQPGVYGGVTEDGERIAKSRGFFAREIDFEALTSGWREKGSLYVAEYPSRRFVGLGASLARSDMSLWRTWHESSRSLSLYPNRKFIELSTETIGVPVVHCPAEFDDTLSERYTPKDGAMQWVTDMEDFMMGFEQPLRDF